MVPVLADAILVLHFAFVLFVVAAVPLIWIGAARGWTWVRNRAFRLAHLAAILFVAAESLIGMTCPLTAWENVLRGVHGERSFVARWVHRILFYDLPEWTFTIAYVAFAALVAWTWLRIPPAQRR